MSALEVHELSAGYRSTPVVSGVSTTVDTGGWLGIIGPNGAGKSTLLKAVAGLVRRSGRVLVDGRPLTGLRRRE